MRHCVENPSFLRWSKIVPPDDLKGLWAHDSPVRQPSSSCFRSLRNRRRHMRKRRKTAEILLARTPARSPRKSQAVPVTVETPKLWPAGATSAQASQWWAEIRSQAQQAAQKPRSPSSRPVPSNPGTGRTLLVKFHHTAKSRCGGETQAGKTRFPCPVSSHLEAQTMYLRTLTVFLGQIQQGDGADDGGLGPPGSDAVVFVLSLV